jgi:nucleoid-associated protein YgaU
MENQLVREKVYLDQTIDKESTQILLEGDIIVPDIKPDMALLLQNDARVVIERIDVSADRVNFIGKLELDVLYIAKGAEKPIYSMSVSAPIDDFITLEGVSKDMWVNAKAELANIDYKMLNDRKINYRAIINVTVSAEYSEAQEIVVDIQDIPASQILKSSLSLNKTVESKLDHFTVKDQITIPASKPNIREILQCSTQLANKDIRVANGRVNIAGELLVATLFKGDDDESFVEFVENDIPFNGSVDVAGAKDDMFADVVLTAQDQYVQVRPDADGEDRVIDIEVSIGVSLKVYSSDSIEILEDAYATDQDVKIAKSPVSYPRLVCRNRNQTTVKEVIQIDADSPDMLQIFKVKGTSATDDIKVIDDKIVAEGIIKADVLYVAGSDETPLYNYQTVIPYKQVIETKGSAPDMRINLDISVDHVAFSMLSPRETEVRFLLTFNTQVIEEKTVDVISDIEFTELDQSYLDNMASLTVYIVQPGDSLWKIAKKYNTSIDEMLSVNEIDNPTKIYPGQKLLILKKAS